MKRWIILILLILFSPVAPAEELIMARVLRPFPEALDALQETIRAHGYTVSRIQRVDVGLASSGFQTAEYRLVFYGRPEEIRDLSHRHVDIVPYLPLNIVIYADGDDTIVLAANPRILGEYFAEPGLNETFARWRQDLQSIFDRLSGPS